MDGGAGVRRTKLALVKPDRALSRTVLRDRVVKILDEARRGLAVAVTIP